jgi:hypothetical protein
VLGRHGFHPDNLPRRCDIHVTVPTRS